MADIFIVSRVVTTSVIKEEGGFLSGRISKSIMEY